MSNLRIYIAVGSFLPIVGGAEKQVLLQGKSLRSRGYEATIITFHLNKGWPKHELIEGVPVIRVAYRILGNRDKLPILLQKVLYLTALVIMGWTLWRQRQQYDILHVYQLTLLALPAALVCKLTGKPIIIGVRNAGLDKAVGPLNKTSLLAGPLDPSLPWLQVRGRIPIAGDLSDLERLGKFVVRYIHSLLHDINAVLVILSSSMKDYLAAHEFVLPYTELIPNGVDLTHFTPISVDNSYDEQLQTVIFIGRLHYQKGIDVLLHAWRLVQQELSESEQARLIIIGTGPIQDQLEHMAQALDVVDSTEFAGLRDDIPEQLHLSNIAVLPSRYEGMPNVVLEAMACGLPCVATRVSGSEDIIQHGINGLLVDPEDYQGLAQALLILLRNRELANNYGQAARATVEQQYSLERITDKYTDLYQRVIACKEQQIDRKENLTTTL